jgi:hypothetical protein
MRNKATLAIGAIFTFIILFVMSLSYWGYDYAIHKVESFMNQQLDAEIDVQRIALNLWKQEINLNNVRINSKNINPLAGCQKLSLSIVFSSLWSDTIQIRHLQMHRPWVYLPVSDNQPLNFEKLLPFFSLVDQLMKKRIFSINRAQRRKNLFLQSFDLLDGKLFFSQTANEQSFRFKHFTINASNDYLNVSGILSYLNSQCSENQILKFETSGSYLDTGLAQSIMTLFSSQSSEMFYEHFLNIVKNLRFQSNGTIQLSNALFQEIGYLKNKISGTFVGAFELNARSDTPKMKVSLEFSGDHINKIPITKIQLHANAEQRLLTINKIILKTCDSQVKIQGIIDLKKIFSYAILKSQKNLNNISWHFLVDSDNFPLYHFHPKIPKFSRFNGQMKIKGNGVDFESFQSEISVNGHTRIPQMPGFLPEIPLKYQVTAHAESDKLSAISMTAQTEGISMTAHGHINRQMIGKVSMNTLVSGQWLSMLGLPEFNTDFHTALTMHRSISETKAYIKVMGNNLTLNQYQLGNMNVDASLSVPGRLTINKASLSHISSKIETKGFVFWNDVSKIGKSLPTNYDISIQSNEIQLHEIYPRMLGNIQLDGNIKGSGKKASGQILLNGHFLNFMGQRIESIHFPVQFSSDGLKMISGNIQMAKNEQINVGFALDKNKNYQVKIGSNSIALSRIKGCIPEIKGMFKIDLEGQGSLKNPLVNGNMIVSPIMYQNKPLPDAVFNIKLAQDILQIDCQSMLDFHAQYHIKNNHLDMRAEAKKMPLAPILACYELSQLNGQLTGKFNMAGKLNDILNAQTSGALQISHATLTYNNLPIAWLNNLDLIIENNLLVPTDFMIRFPEEGFCRGTVSGTLPEQTHLKIYSRIPLPVIQNFSDTITDIKGHLELNGFVQDLLNVPIFEGQINVIDGEFVSTWNNQRLHNIQGQINAKDHIFTLNSFSFGVDDGSCNIQGQMKLDIGQISKIELKGSASAIPIFIPDIADVMINTNLQYTKHHRQSRLAGNIELLEGLYYQQLNVNQMLLEKIQQKRRPDLVAQMCKIFPTICGTELNISIQARTPIVVDNDLAYMEIHPDLNLRGSLYNPVILGRTEMLNGEINYLGKTFTLENGLVDFVNPYRTEPMIQIESNVTIQDWDISLDFQGKLDELQLKFSSSPPEEHADIISILLFGKPTNQLFTHNTGPSKSTQQMIAELISSTFEEDIKKTTGLDTFHLEAYEHETIDDKTQDDYKVTVGKELSRRMSVTYAFETRKGQLIHHTQANYKILENLIFRGMQDTQGAYGGELLLQMEFRQIFGF